MISNQQAEGFIVGTTTFHEFDEDIEGVHIILEPETAEMLRSFLQQSDIGMTKLADLYSALRRAVVAIGIEPDGDYHPYRLSDTDAEDLLASRINQASRL